MNGIENVSVGYNEDGSIKNTEVSANFMHVVGTPLNEGTLTYSTNAGVIQVEDEQDLEVEVKDLQETMEKLLSNPAVKENALTNAVYINDKFRGNWFTVDQMMKKTNLKSYDPASDILTVLCFLGMAYREEKSRGVIKYKITISKEDRYKLLSDELIEAKVKVRDLEGQIEKLLNN